jgi:divalent metal cation (Fe/Co/Zn/Cd) transporter
MIAPVVVVISISVYYFVVINALFAYGVSKIMGIAVLVVSLIMTVLLLVVLVERIKEIRKGEEDDLSQY